MAVQIPFPVPSKGFALNSKLRVNLDFLVDKFNEFNTGTATWDTVAIGTGNDLTGTLTFYNSSNSFYLTIQPGVTASNVTLTLPIDDGDADEFLQTNGSGVLSWEPAIDAGLAGYVAMYNGATFGAASSDLQAYVTQNSNLIRLAISTHAGLAATRTYTVPDAGASASFIMSQGSGQIQGELTISDSPGNLTVIEGFIRSAQLIMRGATAGNLTINPAASFSDHTWTLPDAQGAASTVLTNDGSGLLTWSAPAGTGTVSSGINARLALYNGTGTTVDDSATLTSGGIISFLVADIAANRSYTFPDAGTTSANVLLSQGNKTISGICTFDTNNPIVIQSTGSNELDILSLGNSTENSGILLRVGGASAGDCYQTYRISGVLDWTTGIDNSDSDKFKISQNATLGTNDAIIITTAGEITQPLQPSFLVTDATGATDVTGDTTEYTELWPTEVYDQGGDFTTLFTAPVTGRYLLQASVRIINLLVTHTNRNLNIVTSNRTYSHTTEHLIAEPDCTMFIAVVADMDANDTATVTVRADGSTKTVDVANSASTNFFSGSLIN